MWSAEAKSEILIPFQEKMWQTRRYIVAKGDYWIEKKLNATTIFERRCQGTEHWIYVSRVIDLCDIKNFIT